MPTLICQKRNSDHTVLAVEIEIPIIWDNKKKGIHEELKKGNYLIRDGTEAYQITQKEFEETYLVRRIVS